MLETPERYLIVMEKVEGGLPQSALGSTLLTLLVPESKIHVASI